MTTRPISLAVVGATGLTGRALLEALPGPELDLRAVKLLASQRSVGTRLEVDDDEVPVEALREGAFRGCDVAVFCAPAEVARAWAPRAWAEGCAVIDMSAAFRAEDDVPVVVPEVNAAALDGFRARGIVASPGGSVAALAVALAPLHAAAGLERLVISSLQAVSGAGSRALHQLEREASDLMNGREPDPASALPHRIAFNLVPQVGAFREDGRTTFEESLAAETRKVLGAPALRVAATAVRVPVFYGDAAAVNVTTTRALPVDEARALLRGAPGLKLIDAPSEGVYPMPMLAVNDDAVLVGRIRADPSHERGLDLFVVSDELRRGAANALRIAALLAARL